MNPSSSLDCRETPERSTPAPNPSLPAEMGQMPRIGAPRLRKPQSKSRLDSLPAELLAQVEVWLVDQNRSYDEVDSWRAKEHGVTTTKSSLSRYGRPRQARALSGARMRQPIDANGRAEATLARPRHLGLAARMEPQPDRPTAHRLLEMVTALERTRLAQVRAGLGSGR